MSDIDDFEGRLREKISNRVEKIPSLNIPSKDPYADLPGRDGRYRGLSAGLSTGGMMPRPETPLMRFFKGKFSQEELVYMDKDELRTIMKKLVEVLGPLVQLIQDRTGESGLVRSALRFDDIDEMTGEELRGELFCYMEFLGMLNKASSATLDLNIIGALALRTIDGDRLLPRTFDTEHHPRSD